LSVANLRTLHFVVGFAFSPGPGATKEILLVKKKRPTDQAGLLNGAGGEIEGKETPEQAMNREGKEETALDLEWEGFCTFGGTTADGHEFICHALRALDVHNLHEARALTDEEIVILPVPEVFDHPHVEDLKHLVPMALS